MWDLGKGGDCEIGDVRVWNFLGGWWWGGEGREGGRKEGRKELIFDFLGPFGFDKAMG